MTHLQRLLLLLGIPFILGTLTDGAELSITAANVVVDADATTADGTTTATITAGQAVYDSGSSVYLLTDSNAAGTDDVAGVALNDASADGNFVRIVTAGEVTLGANVMKAGEIYFISDTAGAIQPMSDVTANDFVSTVGYAKSDSIMVVDRMTSSVQNNASGS